MTGSFWPPRKYIINAFCICTPNILSYGHLDYVQCNWIPCLHFLQIIATFSFLIQTHISSSKMYLMLKVGFNILFDICVWFFFSVIFVLFSSNVILMFGKSYTFFFKFFSFPFCKSKFARFEAPSLSLQIGCCYWDYWLKFDWIFRMGFRWGFDSIGG